LLRFAFRRPQFIQSPQSTPRGYPRQPVAHQPRVDELAGLEHDVRETTAVLVVLRNQVALEAREPIEDERLQLVARLKRERRRTFERSADLRRVDAEQPHASEAGDIDRVAVDDSRDGRDDAARPYCGGCQLRG